MKSSHNLRAICLLLCALIGAAIFARTSAAPCALSPFDCAQDLPYPWLYQRDDAPLSSDENIVAVIAMGDVMLGRGLADLSSPFSAVRPWLRAADLTMGNLECVIAEDTESSPPGALYAPPAAAAQLREAGFELLSLANNHTLDLGPQGLAETVSWLERAGIAPVGLGPDPVPLICQVGRVRMAFLAFNAVPSFFETDVSPDREPLRWDPARAAEAVDMARAQADAVIVSIHWGYEYETQVDPAQREAARILSEAGADLVIGHHPHVVQETALVSGHFVAYSLGNFLFDQQQGETRRGLALRAFFDERGLRAVQALPVWAGPRPELMELEEAESLVARIRPHSRHVYFKCDERACRAVEHTQSQSALAESGLFWGGEIDLTGDGVPEQVRRAGERVIVYQDGVEAWRSPDTWRVVDLALGDPNDDGRSEMLLAFWRPDTEAPQAPGAKPALSAVEGPEGIHTSHPFIVGYRGGSYRTLWGGSAVSYPIREVALGDVDGDGAQELIVLEEHGKGSESTVAVWRWHGWGFSLMWRSQPGHYQDLTLIGDGVQTRSVISVSSRLKMP
jgi:poly-gamma-glutamate capsule biosynthesis protein CapA/YwtB (metallophosphatase superfamily)